MAVSTSYINAFSYTSTISNGGGSGKRYAPVSRSSLIYSNFDHVSGVAVKTGQQGVSISKIRILNSLIDRLASIKNEPKKSVQDISDKQADALIKNYQKQISQAMQTPYIVNGAKSLPGELFQIQA